MNTNVMKVLKIVAPVATIATTLLTSFVGEKNLDEKVAKKVAEAMANMKN